MRRLTGVVLLCLLTLSAPSPSAASAGFRDVPATSPHADAIRALAEAGITAGCAHERYCPRSPVTRDQMASFLARALHLDTPAGGPLPFPDIGPSSPHTGAIAALAAAGITTGCADGGFCPRQPVTRDQMASFLTRAFDLPAGEGNGFVDVSPRSPHAAAVRALAAAGITAGCADARYCPRQPVTRDQMASFLARALGHVGPPGPPVPVPSSGPAPADAVLAFTREPIAECAGPCAENTAIWTARVDGGDAQPATESNDAFDRYPRWSPDGRALAFVRTPRGSSSGELHVLDMRNGRFGAARTITATGNLHGGKGCHHQAMEPVWSPDSRRLAVTCAADLAPGAASAVYVVGADGSGQVRVPAASSTADARPTWAPDSRRLAFTRTDLTLPFGQPQRVSIWIAEVGDAALSKPRALVRGTQAADHPRWSPSGDRIAYVSLDEMGLRPSLRVVSAAGGAPTTIYSPPADEAVQLYATAWSPAGGHIAFPVGDGFTRSVVHVVAAGGGPAKAVSPKDALAFAPAWGPSGHLVFDLVTPAASGSAEHQLVTVAADATGQLPMTLDSAYIYDAYWRPHH